VKQGTLDDFDLYGDLPPPVNNIEKLVDDGFIFSNGTEVRTTRSGKPVAAVLLGNEVYQVDLSNGIKGLDTGIVELDDSLLSILNVVYPKPEMLVVGLGGKSRILGPNTQAYIRRQGIQIQLSDSVSEVR
jgi:hypothetical protein